MTQEKDADIKFEQAVMELESIVAGLEKGDLPLEESMQLFERGLLLSKISQQKLNDAEQKIKILASNNQDLMPFDQSEVDS